MRHMNEYIPEPKRDLDKPFLQNSSTKRVPKCHAPIL